MTETRKYGEDFLLQAQAGTFAVASQLCLHGYNPYFPSLDLGCDIVIENGLRLQVKTSSLRIQSPNNTASPTYCFKLQRHAWDRKERKYKRSSVRSYAEVVDFFVLWGIDENRFFIVPANIKKQTICFTIRGYHSKSKNKSLYDKITAQRLAATEDRWDLLDVGALREQIDEISLPSPSTAAKVEKPKRGRPTTEQLMNFEVEQAV